MVHQALPSNGSRAEGAIGNAVIHLSWQQTELNIIKKLTTYTMVRRHVQGPGPGTKNRMAVGTLTIYWWQMTTENPNEEEGEEYGEDIGGNNIGTWG